MATITMTATGNWSDTTKWDLGRIPIAEDDVVQKVENEVRNNAQ